ncbi:hypothetical protein M0811_12637 [Anaeramoeba ignava]|uniref:Reverse transcriptase domain-containing protein n=1 Tax=Anaeramoeba ignava TaxID=1746090 RepID=A0A9Q0R697_ANAIG|nr:hypothetical protein M0811_12637 [Anaeramoeba ignava]
MEEKLIAQIKLKEARRQRQKLTEHYQKIIEKTEKEKDILERIQIMIDGLHEAKFANESLHQDIFNLDTFKFEYSIGALSPKKLEQIENSLKEEIKKGTRRAEFAYIFGCILEEWAEKEKDQDQEEINEEKAKEECRKQVDSWVKPEKKIIKSEILDQIFLQFEENFEQMKKNIQEEIPTQLERKITNDEVKSHLNSLSGNIYQKAENRTKAKAISKNKLLVNEYAGVLTLLINNIEDWNWGQDPIQFRTIWTRNKYRTFVDCDLLTSLLFDIIGSRIGQIIKPLFADLTNDIYGFSEMESNSIESINHNNLSELFMVQIPDFDGGIDEYSRDGDIESPDSFQNLLQYISANVSINQKVRPQDPIYLLRSDFANFYPSINHDLIIFLCEKIGFPKKWTKFFENFLKIPTLHSDKTPGVIKEGVPLNFLISKVFAELVLVFFDLFVFTQSSVRIARVVDDAFFVTTKEDEALNAWESMVTFSKDLNIELNMRKCGNPPRWALLEMKPNGKWGVYESAIVDLEQNMMNRIKGENVPILSKINIYNSFMNYILKCVAPFVSLGQDHLKMIGSRLMKIHNNLFGDHGIEQEIRNSLQKILTQKVDFPEALLFFPVSSGGLGLNHVGLNLASFEQHYFEESKQFLRMKKRPIRRKFIRKKVRKFPIKKRTFGIKKMKRIKIVKNKDSMDLESKDDNFNGEDWKKVEDSPYASDFLEMFSTIEPCDPFESTENAALIQDFISRKNELSGKWNSNLSSYWRWVIVRFGSEILDHFGTFRFLITELVPMQLILSSKVKDTSLKA